MHRSARITPFLACCALLLACVTSPPPAAVPEPAKPPPVSPSACRSSCDSSYEACFSTGCESTPYDQMCPRECVDKLDACRKRCG